VLPVTHEGTRRRWHPGWTVAICATLTVAIFFLWDEHGSHLLGALPYLLLLLCPMFHLLMHRRHHGASGDRTRHG
jgi:hypothetical protein